MLPRFIRVEQWQARLTRLDKNRRGYPTLASRLLGWHWSLEANILRFLLSRCLRQGRSLLRIPPAPPDAFLAPLAWVPASKQSLTQYERRQRLHHIHRENVKAQRSQDERGSLEELYLEALKALAKLDEYKERAPEGDVTYQRAEDERRRRENERYNRRW